MRASSPLLVLVSIFGVLAYLILPILGWGSFSGFFAHPTRTALMVVTVIAAVVAPFARSSFGGGVREDRGNRWVLVPLLLISLANGFVPAYTDVRGIWTLDGDTVRYAGLALYLVGIVLRMWPVFVLGPRFSPVVAIQKDHALVTGGIYGVIRHPSYVGLLVTMLGWVLVFRSAIGVLLVLLMVPALIARIEAEEKLLAAEFGDAYAAYRAHTWRLVPYVY
jgi:protein-S-isoprenylcysteine O-methyltransferase Ste14